MHLRPEPYFEEQQVKCGTCYASDPYGNSTKVCPSRRCEYLTQTLYRNNKDPKLIMEMTSVKTSQLMAGRVITDNPTEMYVWTMTRDERNQYLPDYQIIEGAGKGCFALVYKVKSTSTGQFLAVKKLQQDLRFKNRELQLMAGLVHPNIVKLESHFETISHNQDQVYLNIIMEYMPENLYRVYQQYESSGSKMPMPLVKLYSFQMLRAICHIHSLGICHRDIKPQNMLIDPSALTLKLCDFGHAKHLAPDQENVSYICSRYYRAPELLFSASYYTTAVDIWAAACVIAELILGRPLFRGSSQISQLVEIMSVLGTPSLSDVKSMNSEYEGYTFPHVRATPLHDLIGAEAADLLGRMLVYAPKSRPSAMECLHHPFFNELRDSRTKLPAGLFDWTREEQKELSAFERRQVRT